MHEIPTLDKKGLRNFGLMFGAFISVLFGLLFPFLGDFPFPLWPWIVAGVFFAWALIIPTTLNPFYRVWMRIGLAIGTVVNMIILAFVFYIVILPMSIIMKLTGWRINRYA